MDCAARQEELERASIKVGHWEQLAAAAAGGGGVEAHARKLARATTALEINELVLRRRCAAAARARLQLSDPRIAVAR